MVDTSLPSYGAIPSIIDYLQEPNIFRFPWKHVSSSYWRAAVTFFCKKIPITRKSLRASFTGSWCRWFAFQATKVSDSLHLLWATRVRASVAKIRLTMCSGVPIRDLPPFHDKVSYRNWMDWERACTLKPKRVTKWLVGCVIPHQKYLWEAALILHLWKWRTVAVMSLRLICCCSPFLSTYVDQFLPLLRGPKFQTPPARVLLTWTRPLMPWGVITFCSWQVSYRKLNGPGEHAHETQSE